MLHAGFGLIKAFELSFFWPLVLTLRPQSTGVIGDMGREAETVQLLVPP